MRYTWHFFVSQKVHARVKKIFFYSWRQKSSNSAKKKEKIAKRERKVQKKTFHLFPHLFRFSVFQLGDFFNRLWFYVFLGDSPWNCFLGTPPKKVFGDPLKKKLFRDPKKSFFWEPTLKSFFVDALKKRFLGTAPPLSPPPKKKSFLGTVIFTIFLP